MARQHLKEWIIAKPSIFAIVFVALRIKDHDLFIEKVNRIAEILESRKIFP